MSLQSYYLSAIVVAGGTGSRMGLEQPKQFALMNGQPILVHTLERLLNYSPLLKQIVLVMHPDWTERWVQLGPKYLTQEELKRIQLVDGGTTRTDSVWNGLQEIEPKANTLVAIQDGVRPLLTHKLLQASYAMAAEKGSGICAVPVKSSMRRKTDIGSTAVDRSEYYAVQTPQTFRLDLLLDAYRQQRGGTFTDDASLVEANGTQVYLCEGDYNNLKITTPGDMELAKMLLRANLGE